jgi:hypothetical protein
LLFIGRRASRFRPSSGFYGRADLMLALDDTAGPAFEKNRLLSVLLAAGYQF